MTTSIFTSISSFLARRYNLNTTLSDRDRESLARDIAYNLNYIPITSSSQTQEQQQQQLPHDNTDLVVDGNDDKLLETTLQELEQTLDQCELSLNEFEKKERFLFVRIARYRKMIRDRECSITEIQEKRQQQEKKKNASRNNDDNDISSGESKSDPQQIDVENNDNNTTEDKISQLILKHQQDQSKLQDVETIHADIIAQIETLKRRILDLEDKKQDILKKREECREFLVEVAEKL
jgi:chromosome segregation ATPase